MRAVELREAEGRDRMILKLDRKSEPRVLPGVMGIYVGWVGDGCVVDVAVADVRRYLEAL